MFVGYIFKNDLQVSFQEMGYSITQVYLYLRTIVEKQLSHGQCIDEEIDSLSELSLQTNYLIKIVSFLNTK